MKYLGFLLLMCLSGRMVAQETDSALTKVIPRHALKISPLHLMNFYPTIQFGYEARIRNRFSLYTEGGIAVNLDQLNDQFLNKRGVKLKLEPRYYLSVSRKGNVAWYAAGEIYYNRINFDRRESRTECFDESCQILFQRRTSFKAGYREHGVGLKGGLIIGRNRLYLDINSGFALRFVDYLLPEVRSPWGFDDQTQFEIPNEEDRTAFGPLLGVRLGYRIVRTR